MPLQMTFQLREMTQSRIIYSFILQLVDYYVCFYQVRAAKRWIKSSHIHQMNGPEAFTTGKIRNVHCSSAENKHNTHINMKQNRQLERKLYGSYYIKKRYVHR